MKKTYIINLALGVVMVLTAMLTIAMTPTTKIADQRDTLDLETLIPPSFKEWRIDTNIVPLQIDPKSQAQLDKIYNQVLARTYVNSEGVRVMLSVAYGGDQSDHLSLHKPEVCYLAQGFEIKQNTAIETKTMFGSLPCRRLLAVREHRIEPITYWVTIGDKAVLSGLDQKLHQIRYGFSGKVPDGMLVRVSTLDANIERAYQIHTVFIQDMLASMDVAARERLTGIFDF